MKVCAKCDAMAADQEVVCPACGARLSDIDLSTVSIASDSRDEVARRLRPDGTGAQSVGIALGLIGIVLIAVSAFMGTTEYSWGGDIDPDKVAWKASLSLIGGGLFQIGLVVWIAGYIVHAISFLPGREA